MYRRLTRWLGVKKAWAMLWLINRRIAALNKHRRP